MKNTRKKGHIFASKTVKIKMKNLLVLSLALLSLASCKSKKSAESAENLPKDIALKPENNLSQQNDRDELSKKIKEINLLIAAEPCIDPTEWKFTAIGAKPCGGPSSYIAYPNKLEGEILPKIQNFTAMQAAFNKKYNLMSDCAMVMPPSGIKCENGKAVLVTENTGATEVQ
ncbi:MAG: hypothetical protein L6264_08495 [Weeksellaceae bacterium]|nr:hypothetical protein [Weeksellaceae bacterium]